MGARFDDNNILDRNLFRFERKRAPRTLGRVAVIALLIAPGVALSLTVATILNPLANIGATIASVTSAHASQSASAASATPQASAQPAGIVSSSPDVATSPRQSSSSTQNAGAVDPATSVKIADASPQNASSVVQHLAAAIATGANSGSAPSAANVISSFAPVPPTGTVLGAATSAVDTVTHAELQSALNGLRTDLYAQVANTPPAVTFSGPAPTTPISTQAFAASQKIDNLSGVVITNATVNGVSGLTAADIPALDYFPASTTISVAYGGTGTSTVPAYGQLLLGQPNGSYALVATSSLGIVGGSGSPGGSTGQIQFNAYSSFSASSAFTFATSTETLSVTNASTTNATSTNLFASVASSTSLYAQAAALGTLTANGLAALSGGLLSLASTTIGNGTQAGGLTISGGATTTGNAYFAGNVGIGADTRLYRSGSNALAVDNGAGGAATLSVPGAGARSEQFGVLANASVDDSVAVGNSALVDGSAGGIGIGSGARGHSGGIAIGYNANSAGNNIAGSVVIGYNAQASYTSVAIGGGNVDTTGCTFCIGVGSGASVLSGQGIAIGHGTVSHGGAVLHGAIFGNNNDQTTSATQANGSTFASANGSGTDIPGSNTLLVGGQGTGAGAGGSLLFQTAPAGASGTSLNNLLTRMIINNAGNVGIGTSNPAHALDVSGDCIAWMGTCINTSAPANTVTYTAGSYFFSSNTAQAINTTRFLGPAGTAPATTDIDGYVVPTTGTLSALYVTADANSYTSATATFTLMKNTVATSMTCQLAAAGLTCNDTAHSTSVTVGDRISIRVVSSNAGSGSLTRSNVSVEFKTTTSVFSSQWTTGSDGFSISYATTSNKVGIGTTTPYAALTVWGANTSAATKVFEIANSASTTLLSVTNDGSVGIGTTSPSTALQVHGVVTPDGDNTYTLGNATYRWAAVYAANGTIQTSDRRLKSNITPLTYGLSDILKLQPVSFTWTAHPEQGTKLGFIAQDVQPIMPEVVNVGDDAAHTLGLNYTEFIPAIVKAMQELSGKLDALAIIVANFAESFTTKELTFTRATGTELSVQKLRAGQLCADKSDGTLVCLTGDQLAALLAQAGGAVAPGSISLSPTPDLTNSAGTTSAGSSTPAIDANKPQPPVVQINGENPAIIHVGDTYNDLGATIVAPQADINLGIKTFLNGRLVSDIVIDTTHAATDTIDYAVTAPSGTAATSTRVVVIAPVTAGAPPLAASTTPPFYPPTD